MDSVSNFLNACQVYCHLIPWYTCWCTLYLALPQNYTWRRRNFSELVWRSCTVNNGQWAVQFYFKTLSATTI